MLIGLVVLVFIGVGVWTFVVEPVAGILLCAAGLTFGLLILLLWRRGTKMVFSDYYREQVISATKHLERSNPAAVIGLVIVLTIVVAGIAYGVMLVESL